jgi:hypothetical protein
MIGGGGLIVRPPCSIDRYSRSPGGSLDTERAAREDVAA